MRSLYYHFPSLFLIPSFAISAPSPLLSYLLEACGNIVVICVIWLGTFERWPSIITIPIVVMSIVVYTVIVPTTFVVVIISIVTTAIIIIVVVVIACIIVGIVIVIVVISVICIVIVSTASISIITGKRTIGVGTCGWMCCI